jgi:hypothetical protein
MKSEHRHELAENDLAKLLNRWGAEFDKHVNVILTVLVVIALVYAGYWFWSSSSSASNADGWKELAAATDATEYVGVAEKFPGTSVAEWATLRAANSFLQSGIRQSLTDRPTSNESLQQASESFESLLSDSSVSSQVREQALIGNALTLETLSDGDTADAIAAYEALLDEFPTSRFTTFADDRIKALKTGGVQEFYAWFHQLNPKPADRPMPDDQSNPIDPSGLGNLLPELNGGQIPLDLLDSDKGDAASDEENPFAEQEMKDKAADQQQDDAAAAATPEQSAPAEESKSEPEKPTSDSEDSASPEAAGDKPAEKPESEDSSESP